jgi:DNA polymerase V
MFAIVDCNSFYCSCERLFRPELEGKPVVVLSNNDGCIIARSDEAKNLGIDMGIPYFMAKSLIEKNGVATFSSNYNLYGNLSWRVMETLRILIGQQYVEVYSVDEAFIDLRHIPPSQIMALAKKIKTTVEMWTGIKVSVGVAPTKVLSKVANRLAKKHKEATSCVLVLDTPNKIMQALERTPVADIWGIGRQYAQKLLANNILTAHQLSKQTLMWAHKHLGGVVGVRLLRELQGNPSIEMQTPLICKQMIATTRMFGKPVNSLQHIKEAVATYTARAAEKLRRQYSVAKAITVFIVQQQPANSYSGRYKHGPSLSASTTLTIATSSSGLLIKQALLLAEQLYQEGGSYKKAGVILGHIVPNDSIQCNLFVANNHTVHSKLMQAVDNINFAMRNDIVKFAASGTERNWKMQQNFISPRYTTRWHELCLVH